VLRLAAVPVFNALLIGHITPAGELACLSSEFIPAPPQTADPAMLALMQSGADLPWSSPLAIVAPVIIANDPPSDICSTKFQERAYDIKRTTIAFQRPATIATPSAGSRGHPQNRGGAN
jgi:hypothetical protein